MVTGISTASMFGKGLLEENLKQIGQRGVRHAEVFLNTFSEYSEAYVRILAGIAGDYGIAIHSVHPHGVQFEPQMFYGYERTANDAFGMFERVLAAGQALGAQTYVFHGGMFYKPATHHRHNFARIGSTIDKAADLAARYGLALAYENVHWCWFSSPEFGEKLLEHVHSDNLAFTLDIKQAAQSGVSALKYLPVMAGRLRNVHICDFTHTENGVKTCLPFRGEMDFAALRQGLLGIGYEGPVMLEVYRQDYESETELFSCYQDVERLFAPKKPEAGTF